MYFAIIVQYVRPHSLVPFNRPVQMLRSVIATKICITDQWYMTSERLVGLKDNIQLVDVKMAESNCCQRVGMTVTPNG
jgi:hypothetical protein